MTTELPTIRPKEAWNAGRPLFFASNAIYPIAIMPNWLKTISRLNPLTYVVDALRTFMLAGRTSTFGLSQDYAVIRL
jgi:ABC-2 type transport system permease protein